MPRQLNVIAARDLGPQFVDNPHRMVGQDGAFSFRLPDGSSFWFFGDTLVGRRPPGSPWVIDGKIVDHRDMSGMGPYERMINNTGLILPPQSGAGGLRDFRYLLDDRGQLRTLLPLEGEEHPDWDRMWCQHGIALDDRMVLSFIQVRMLPKNDTPLPIGFEIVGSGLATARTSGAPGEGRGEGSFGRFQRSRFAGSHILWKADEPHFGTAFLKGSDGYIYVYGTVNRDGRQGAYLSRVTPDRIDQLPAYEYFAGGRWSPSVADAVELFGSMPSEISVSFNAHLGSYLAVHSLDLSGQIVGRTAPAPWGPWSEPTVLWQVEAAPLDYDLPYPFRLIYAGKEHAQLSADGGRTIYMTYIEFEEYFPHLIEVVLA